MFERPGDFSEGAEREGRSSIGGIGGALLGPSLAGAGAVTSAPKKPPDAEVVSELGGASEEVVSSAGEGAPELVGVASVAGAGGVLEAGGDVEVGAEVAVLPDVVGAAVAALPVGGAAVAGGGEVPGVGVAEAPGSGARGTSG